MNKSAKLLMAGIMLALIGLPSSQARQFRQMNPIPSVHDESVTEINGIRSVKQFQEISRSEIRPIIEDILSKWNTPEMAETISTDFYDFMRLLDVVDTGVPRDARLRLQGIQRVQTLEQYIEQADDGVEKQISLVSATIRTQLEFNSPNTGQFVNLIGTNELILRVIKTR